MRGPAWTAEQHAALRELAAQGLTRHQVAARLGASYSQVCSLLRKYRIDPPRQPWRTSHQAYDVPEREELEDAVKRWGTGGAAEEYEVAPDTIRYWLKTLRAEAAN